VTKLKPIDIFFGVLLIAVIGVGTVLAITQSSDSISGEAKDSIPTTVSIQKAGEIDGCTVYVVSSIGGVTHILKCPCEVQK
jgi:hypothetical protein